MARSFDRGCLEFIHVPATIEIHFPIDQVICDLCDFCHTENGGTRFRCLRTAEILPYHNKTIGLRCPLDIPQIYKSKETEETDND